MPLPRHEHYHEATIITVAPADGDKSCDRNDSAKLLLARIRARSFAVPVVAWSRKSRTPAYGRSVGGEIPPRERRGCATFPHHVDVEDRAAAREAMSVTSGNYARVPVAIGLLILLESRLGTFAARAADLLVYGAAWLVAATDGSGLS